jgi:hypothetical protein
MIFVPNAPAREFGRAKNLVVSYHPSTSAVSISSDVPGATIVAEPTAEGGAVLVQEILADGTSGEKLEIVVVQPTAAPEAPAAE